MLPARFRADWSPDLAKGHAGIAMVCGRSCFWRRAMGVCLIRNGASGGGNAPILEILGHHVGRAVWPYYLCVGGYRDIPIFVHQLSKAIGRHRNQSRGRKCATSRRLVFV